MSLLSRYFPWWRSEITRPRNGIATTRLPVSNYEALQKDFHRLAPGILPAALITPSGVSYAPTTGTIGVSTTPPAANTPNVDKVIQPSGVGGVAYSNPTPDNVIALANVPQPGR